MRSHFAVARRRAVVPALLASASVGALLLSGTAAGAACAPPALANAPVPGTQVTCSGITSDQNNPSGYGNRRLSELSVEIEPHATVIGTQFGIELGNQNSITNRGSIEGKGAYGLAAGTGVTLTNFGLITGSSGGVSQD